MLSVSVLTSGSGGNCYLVSDGQRRLLLDCGVPFAKVQQFAGYKVAELAGALISHRHRDHALAADKLLQRGVKVYGTPDVAATYPGAIAVTPRQDFALGAFAVTPFCVEHDVPCYGYVVDAGTERLAYITDAKDVDVSLPEVTTLMIEANHDPELLWQHVREGKVPYPVAKRIARSHMPIATTMRLVGEIAAKSPHLREVWLLHTSANNAAAGQFRERVQAITSAAVRVAGE